ncbi:unnamed protein product [Peronospora farinosa]|uniref:Uncharacterized protein n=1 Tax=Peronospora farinosa TaxID=134698 RepID=A0AAV0SUE9_9STRA|nr:unnamed protein product [Peronospora farinosa]CAI5708529.1 unnamed protein product [Peronospora farinosa]
MSTLDINWLRPMRPDSPTPLQILINWFRQNGVVYHASAHQREVLGPLCRELNARGFQCEVDQILKYINYLKEILHDATVLNRDIIKPLKPYQDHLEELLFKDGHADVTIAQQKARSHAPSRLSWLEPSAYSGPSGMEVLVDWLKSNYSAYAHATRKGEKGKMLEELVKEMKDAGIQDCAVNTVRAKIDVLHREVRGEKTRSAAWEQFGSVLEEIFTMGDAGQERDDVRDGGESVDSREDENLDHNAARDDAMEEPERLGSITGQQPADNTNNDAYELAKSIVSNGKVSMVMKNPVRKHARNSPNSRLSWMKSAAPGAPTAMELLIEWMERYYVAYTQSTKKGDKGKMLAELLRKIEGVGHRGCTIHAIRVKIDSLQRQAGGRARPSSAFDQYGASLKKVFAERDGIDHIEPRVLSPVGIQDDEKLHNSDEDDLACDEIPGELVMTEGNASPDYPSALTDRFTTEQVVMPDIESHNAEETNVFEDDSNSNHATTFSNSDTEEDVDQPAKKKIAVPEVRRFVSTPAPSLSTPAPSLSTPAPSQPTLSPPTPSPSPSTLSPSATEIVRIATLLRERHDLHQRGVPQEQIDKFLPLPNV